MTGRFSLKGFALVRKQDIGETPYPSQDYAKGAEMRICDWPDSGSLIAAQRVGCAMVTNYTKGNYD